MASAGAQLREVPGNEKQTGDQDNPDKASSAYRKMLKSGLGLSAEGAAAEGSGSRVLSFRTKAPVADSFDSQRLEVLYSSNKWAAETPKSVATKTLRHIPERPTKILDAPDLLDGASSLPYLFCPLRDALGNY